AAIAIGDLFAAGEVAFIMALGEKLEHFTVDRAKRGLEKLIRLTPTTARRLTSDGDETITIDRINVGDVVRVLPGETIPIDGTIVSGRTSIDQSIMTGESLPIDKTAGDGVFGGTINRFGSIDLRADRVGEDSSLHKLIRLVQEAESKKAPLQRIADVWASRLVPMALLTAIATYFATGEIVRAVTVLVVFCPCALVLATPTAVMAAIGQATKHGVIVKSGEALELMGKVDVIAFDKTGTLTHGTLKVSDVVSFGSMSREEILETAAALESKSEHPIGKAIVQSVDKKIIPSTTEFEMKSGLGISAMMDGRRYFVGNEKFLNENGLDIGENKNLNALREQGKALVLLGDGRKCLGAIALSDVIRAEARSVIDELKELGTRSMLLTGDNRRTADYFAQQVGIGDVHSELMPEGKVAQLEAIRSRGLIVCMIGDGVNDAPALKTADVGIAPGAMGSDIAVDAADIALMTDDMSRIPYLKRLANATRKTIFLSISLSMAINFIAIVLSVEGLLTPTTGALVHNLGSCFVVMIAALLYDRNFEQKAHDVKGNALTERAA
ncbi:MAG: cadmium-translocating P-type ATPase, partial [Selenomonadaceae bacterium]|nr:cadmium-translocating P-type ATPase [Selenomonadaceae bacterium]